jgi:DNA invertase Pin-like site-specific DNA recombinase
VAEIYTDNDQSAYRGKPRPSYRRLLGDIEAGQRDGLVVWHPDRLHRSPVELEEFIALVEGTGVAVGTVTAGEYDLTTPTGRMQARIVGAVARNESEHKAERVIRKQLENRENGVQHAAAAFGLDSSEHANAVREAARRILDEGASLRQIAADWNGAGLTTAKTNSTRAGTAWSSMKVGRLLRAPALAGLLVHDGEVVGPGTWEPVIPEVEWRRLVRALGGRVRTRGDAKPVLLRGLVYCADCGQKMTTLARSRTGSAVSYVCAKAMGGCGSMAASAPHVDKVVEERALVRLIDPKTRRALAKRQSQQPDTGPLLAAIRNDEELLAEIDADRVAGRLNRTRYLLMQQPVEERLKSTKAALARLDAAAALPVTLPSVDDIEMAWDGAALEVRRVWLTAILDHLDVVKSGTKAPAFDRNRVQCSWRV